MLACQGGVIMLQNVWSRWAFARNLDIDIHFAFGYVFLQLIR